MNASSSSVITDDNKSFHDENLSLNDLNDLASTSLLSVEEGPDVYAFESDHVCLKGNKDYQFLLESLVTYEAQRSQAINDMNTLMNVQDQALSDPVAFVEKLQAGNVQMPKEIFIGPLYEVEWEKYTSLPEHLIGLRRQSARRGDKQVETFFSENGSSNPDDDSFASAPTLVRGRAKDESKPETFNQLWTVEEQKRLEDLLIKYPPEDVEARRFDKIAAALGNRTPIQVASRIQKYFIKLAKAGLPIRGRTPRPKQTLLMNVAKRKQRNASMNRHYMESQSTFLQSHQLPVYMSNDDDEDGDSYPGEKTLYQQVNASSSQEEDLSDDEFPLEFRLSPEYRELLKLRRLRRLKESSSDVNQEETIKHTGYKCDRCALTPIRGIRWNCQDCPESVSIDLCSLCVERPFETSEHDSSHRLLPIRRPPVQGLDKDYTKFDSNGYNYLDPNYMPAT